MVNHFDHHSGFLIFLSVVIQHFAFTETLLVPFVKTKHEISQFNGIPIYSTICSVLVYTDWLVARMLLLNQEAQLQTSTGHT